MSFFDYNFGKGRFYQEFDQFCQFGSKKQRHFLIVTSEKTGFTKDFACFVSLDQKTAVFFDCNFKKDRT